MSTAHFFTYGKFGSTPRLDASAIVRMDVVTDMTVEHTRSAQEHTGAYTGVMAITGLSPVTRVLTIRGVVTQAIRTGESIAATRHRITSLVESVEPIAFVSAQVVFEKCVLTSARMTAIGSHAMDVELKVREIRNVTVTAKAGVAATKKSGGVRKIASTNSKPPGTGAKSKTDAAANSKQSRQSLLFKASEALRQATSNW